MSLTYSRDNARRLITVTASDVPTPVSVEETLAVIDRQWIEGTWDYALLYDFRGTAHVATAAEAEALQDQVQRIGLGLPRGPVGLAVRIPAMVRVGIGYAQTTSKIQEFELLMTQSQIDAWLARHVR